MNTRFIAVKNITKILEGQSLRDFSWPEKLNNQDLSFAKYLTYGVIRHYFLLEEIANLLVTKRLDDKNLDIHVVILSGIYQLIYMEVPDYAAINESVDLAEKLNKTWAKNLINAVLRKVTRSKEELIKKAKSKSLSAKLLHPTWLIEDLKIDWPKNYVEILKQNNKHAPQVIRINTQKISLEKYIEILQNKNIDFSEVKSIPNCLIIDKNLNISEIPFFKEGYVSIQDGSAQLAAHFLELDQNKNLDILDACGAPGGKACHILDLAPHSNLTIIEKDKKRIKLIEENLTRLNQKAKIICDDSSDIESWNKDNLLFDRILLDAPCSATGVIRRNPDIKVHREYDDIESLMIQQEDLLNNLFYLLKPNGLILYATCSILKDENEHIIKNFMEDNNKAKIVGLKSNFKSNTNLGLQIFPGQEEYLDGFYYCLIKKVNN